MSRSKRLVRSFLVVVVTSSMWGCASCNREVSNPMDGVGVGAVTQKVAADPGSPAIPGPGINGTSGPVAIELTPQYGKLLERMEAEINLLMTIEGDEVAAVKRQPLDLAIVIDRSGSMSGDKIASVKVAALELLKRLQEEDRVTLISYSHFVTVHATDVHVNEAGRELMKQEILSIRADGMTALGPAMVQALDILARGRTGEVRLSHCMLLSDGLANTGEKSPDILGNRASASFGRGVSLSTLGVGLDYNEDLMTHLADQGGGQYHFIKDNQMVASVLSDEFKGLMATVAREMDLEIIPAAGIQVTEVFGYPLTRESGQVGVRIGSLRASQTRDIVLSMKGRVDGPGEVEVGSFKLTFKDVLKDGLATEWSGVLRVKTSGDQVAVRESEMTEVTVRLAEVQGAQEMEVAARAVDKGDFAQAQVVLEKSIATLREQAVATPSEDLDQQIVEMEDAKTGIEKAKESASARKTYVKSRKSSAYKKGKKGKARGVWKKAKKKSSSDSYSKDPWAKKKAKKSKKSKVGKSSFEDPFSSTK